eukprot:scaffold59826_cov21-Prasinocladus_malaysianus.AAC.1
MFGAMKVAGQVVSRLQAHYKESVLPLVLGTRNEEAKCSAGLAGFLNSTQGAVVRGANASLTAFFKQYYCHVCNFLRFLHYL